MRTEPSLSRLGGNDHNHYTVAGKLRAKTKRYISDTPLTILDYTAAIYIPLHNVQARHSILASNSIQISIQDSNTNTGPARAGRSDVAAPLVRLGVIPGKQPQICFYVLRQTIVRVSR